MVAGARGGEEAIRVLNEMDRRTGAGDETVVNVGFFEDAKYPDGTQVAMVALWQNFGTSKIPPRPFFSDMIESKQKEWGPALGLELAANGYDAHAALDKVGDGMAGQLVQSIQETNEPPLAESTLKARGVDPKLNFNASDPSTYGAKPLVRSGKLIASPQHQVVKMGRRA